MVDFGSVMALLVVEYLSTQRFMQDNAPCQKARATLLMLSMLEMHGIEVLDWPPYSPDLNPIELLELDEKLDSGERWHIRITSHLWLSSLLSILYSLVPTYLYCGISTFGGGSLGVPGSEYRIIQYHDRY